MGCHIKSAINPIIKINICQRITNHDVDSAPSHYLNQCWLIANWTHRNKLQWHLNQITKLLFHENASENIVCEKAAILSRGEMRRKYLLHLFKSIEIQFKYLGIFNPRNRTNTSHICILPQANWRRKELNRTTRPWASCQIRKIAGAHAPGMPGTFSPSPQVSDPDMHHGTCVTHVPWCMPGSLTSGFIWNRRRGETFPAFPAHAQPAILRIW